MDFYNEIKHSLLANLYILRNFFSCVFFLLAFSTAGWAQQYLFGRVFKNKSQEVLPGVTLQNINTKKYNKSDMGGNYRVAATAGDTIIFSSAGYHADTIVISNPVSTDPYDIFLTPNIVALEGIEIDELSKYEADSTQRRIDYAFIFDRKHPVKLVNEKRPGDAPGLNFSPIGYFSKGEKQKRRLKERVIEEDEEEYIDARFPRSRVALLTKLTGDSLQQFMQLYRPSYKFCRATDGQRMFLYINDKLILFKQGKNKKKK